VYFTAFFNKLQEISLLILLKIIASLSQLGRNLLKDIASTGKLCYNVLNDTMDIVYYKINTLNNLNTEQEVINQIL